MSAADGAHRLKVPLQEAAELTARRLCKYFDRGGAGPVPATATILQQVDMELPAGAITGLAGPTGVGKSTLGRILVGILRPDGGQVRMGAVDIFKQSPGDLRYLRRWLRYVPQNPDAVVSSRRRVRDVLDEAEQRSPLDAADRKAWRASVLRADLIDPDWMDRNILALSLGQRRRIISVRGLLSCPRFMVMDEPLNGLDRVSKACMLDLLRTASEEWNAGTLLISHDTEALTQVSSRIWHLVDGTLRPWS